MVSVFSGVKSEGTDAFGSVVKFSVVTVLTLAVLFPSSFCAAADSRMTVPESGGSRAALIGHNTTPLATSLPKGTLTVGNYAAGVALTDTVFLATSPWIWSSYNTANLHLRVTTPYKNRTRYGLFLSYFDSFDNTAFLQKGNFVSPESSFFEASPAQTSRYQWESGSTHFLASYDFTAQVTTHLNLHYAYFWNDDFPYSIRMDPGKDTIRDQVDLTSMTQIRIPDTNVQWLVELGVLGLNYELPYLQLGSSFSYLDKSWLIQMGASFSIPMRQAFQRSGWELGRYDDRLHYTANGEAYIERYLQSAIHPEVQVQFFF